MAEFSEIIKQFKRMCKSVTPMKCARGECPMGCENIGQCRKVAFERPEKFEEQVTAWAAEHPEPVYPTWMEWLTDVGAIPKAISWDEPLVEAVYDAIQNPIPADMAQKLGLSRREKRNDERACNHWLSRDRQEFTGRMEQMR